MQQFENEEEDKIFDIKTKHQQQKLVLYDIYKTHFHYIKPKEKKINLNVLNSHTDPHTICHRSLFW